MSRESPYFRETLAVLHEVFGKDTYSITVAQYAEYLKIDKKTLADLVKEKKFPGVQMGRKFSIPLNSIAQFECRAGRVT